MAVDSKVITAATTATLVHTGAGYQVVTIHNPAGGQAVYLGPADVTADTTAATGGLILPIAGTLQVKLEQGEVLYARVTATTQVLHVLVTNN